MLVSNTHVRNLSLDKEMAEAKAAAQRPASGPQDGQPNAKDAKDQEEDDTTTQERKAVRHVRERPRIGKIAEDTVEGPDKGVWCE